MEVDLNRLLLSSQICGLELGLALEGNHGLHRCRCCGLIAGSVVEGGRAVAGPAGLAAFKADRVCREGVAAGAVKG